MADDVRWTAKAPALIAGLILLLASAFLAAKGWARVAIVVAVLGAGFVGYSATLKDWCQLHGSTLGQSPWGQGWGGSFGECLKAKGYLSF